MISFMNQINNYTLYAVGQVTWSFLQHLLPSRVRVPTLYGWTLSKN